tara:strand:+ start:49 stop:504 length:456 start_codon:yes stop_codon:yes gene_type:complete
MNYLGLDCSSLAVHGVIIDDDEKIISMHKWGSKNKDFTQRFPEITLDFFDELSRINNIDKSSIEAAIFIQNPKTTIAIAHVVGAVWLSLLWKGIETNRIENTKWKKIILNKGNASKDDIKQFSIDKWGNIFPEQDYADAACIALYSKRRET